MVRSRHVYQSLLRHARPCCLARRHNRPLFGDMTDTLVDGQVDGCDLVGAEEDAVLAIGGEWTDSDALAAEGARNVPQPSLEADVVLGGADGADNLAVVVFDRRQAVGHGARARPIAACRDLLAESLVRPVVVVDHAPAMERAPHIDEIAEPLQGQHLGLQGAMEALVLAAALWMIGPAMQHSDAELEQPHTKAGPVLARGVAPGGAVVDEYRLRQPVAAEGVRQALAHGGLLLVGTSLDRKRIA